MAHGYFFPECLWGVFPDSAVNEKGTVDPSLVTSWHGTALEAEYIDFGGEG